MVLFYKQIKEGHMHMMDKQEILITTAFFDINRSNWASYSRSNENYLNYFKTWAGLDNQIVAYFNDQNIADKVYEIRKSLNRADKTKIIVIDYTKIEPEILKRIQNIANNQVQKDFHVRSDSPESTNALYVYIMFLKSWCLKDAAELFPDFQMQCWLDFGFGRGSDIFTNPSEFNFSYKVDYSDKIIFQPVKEIKDVPPVFDLARTGDTFISGGFFIGPRKIWNYFYEEITKYINSLLDCGFIDDDQTLELMFLINHPDFATTFPAGKYYDGFCSLSNKELSINKSELKIRAYEVIQIRQALVYSFKTFRYLVKNKTKQ